MDVPRELHVHLLHQVEQIAQYLEHVHPFRPQPGLRRLQALADLGHAPAQALDLLLHIPANHRVVLLPHHQIEVAPCGLVEVVHRGQARGTA